MIPTALALFAAYVTARHICKQLDAEAADMCDTAHLIEE